MTKFIGSSKLREELLRLMYKIHKKSGANRKRTLKNKRKMNKAYGKFFCKPVYTNKLHFFNKNVTGIMHKKLAAKGGGERGSIEISCLCADQSRY